ncbi:HBR542Wp [Eremothecium sinecaudum]|uniref:Protein SQS1 n=1 Tax=Eremothecium sinecaudum TaxID=45286 RepID=A0A109UXN8_9SACH|nr:HBR542Wp [Eremothecium sinecaudum]AMD19443.1 HBR542Wp [Eremothecium sinecaudum]
MAKRHKHYESRGSRRGRGRDRGRHRRPAGKRAENNGRNDDRRGMLLVGGGDLMNPNLIEDYYFGNGSTKSLWKKDSMRMGGLRRGMYGAGNKDDNNNLGPARKNPISFIKAKETYDPSQNMIQLLGRKDTSSAETVPEMSDSSEEIDNIESEDEDEEDEEDEEETEVIHKIDNEETDIALPSETARYKLSEITDEMLYFVDEEGDELEQVKEVRVKETRPSTKGVDFNPILTVGKTEIHLNDSDNGTVYVENPERHKAYQKYIQNVMHRIENGNDDSDDESGTQGSDLSSILNYDVDGSFEGFFDDEESLRPQSLSNNIGNLSLAELASESGSDLESDNESSESGDPKFGFLEEDYLVDTSQIKVSNIRLGATENSYYVSCLPFFGNDDYTWISHDLMLEVIDEIGLAEHRIEAYLRYIKNGLIPKEEKKEDLGEGLDDLVAYSLKYESSRNQDFENKSLQYTGRGKKKQVIIDDDLELDESMKEMIEEKVTVRAANKADKRNFKEKYINEENQNSTDLFKKYPYGFHIENIVDEFQNFLYSTRSTMEFPPLDPHGRRTLQNLATGFELKSKQVGQGNKVHILIQKRSRSKPNYDYINKIRRQRRVFMRVDTKAARLENEKYTMGNIAVAKGKFHVKEGEVVGEDAPEIAHDNVGRRLLEKLGWIRGEGLGVLGNKGISEPLMAKVKNSRSGLRHSES